ncbi:MAG: hypothetical protein BHW46_00590 [Roseburia intestinalis]|nr:MAG: hypothetical protein BHW46_00590 [Roseburia intestinalis]
MRNKKILQKAAKKSLSWLLILGMLVTLPETPGAISAAAAELETGTEETVHEESSDADRMEETKNAVTEKTGETETKADTAVQEETGTSQSQETKEPETETQDAEAENEDAETEDAEAAVTEAENEDAETEAPVTETTEDETELSEETEETETEQEVKAVEGCNLLEYLTQRDIQTKNSGVNVRYRGKHRFFKGFNEFIKEKTRRCDNDFEKIERHVFF